MALGMPVISYIVAVTSGRPLIDSAFLSMTGSLTDRRRGGGHRRVKPCAKAGTA